MDKCPFKYLNIYLENKVCLVGVGLFCHSLLTVCTRLTVLNGKTKLMQKKLMIHTDTLGKLIISFFFPPLVPSPP